MASLSTATKRVLRKASSEPIQTTLASLKRHFKRGQWIGLSNRYRENTITKLKADVLPGASINIPHLAQYVAASCPLHCADGWSLLGRALDCHARRDADSARHFAYYAELRAAISLLASQGIAVFD